MKAEKKTCCAMIFIFSFALSTLNTDSSPLDRDSSVTTAESIFKDFFSHILQRPEKTAFLLNSNDPTRRGKVGFKAELRPSFQSAQDAKNPTQRGELGFKADGAPSFQSLPYAYGPTQSSEVGFTADGHLHAKHKSVEQMIRDMSRFFKSKANMQQYIKQVKEERRQLNPIDDHQKSEEILKRTKRNSKGEDLIQFIKLRSMKGGLKSNAPLSRRYMVYKENEGMQQELYAVKNLLECLPSARMDQSHSRLFQDELNVENIPILPSLSEFNNVINHKSVFATRHNKNGIRKRGDEFEGSPENVLQLGGSNSLVGDNYIAHMFG